MSISRTIISREEKIFNIVNILIMLLILTLTIYPFLNVLAISFNESSDTVKGGITIFPRKFTIENYKVIFTYNNLVSGFINSVLRTIVGTLTSLIACSMVAYTLGRKHYIFRKQVSLFLVITMYVSGGLIPFFLLVRDLHLMNSFLVYILPGMVGAFNIIIIRSFMENLPEELYESAYIDGANEFTVFLKIIIPLSTPVLATIALFVAVGQWNNWFDTYLFNGSDPSLTTLMFELMKVLQSTQRAGADAVRTASQQLKVSQVSPESVKMAITIVTIVPILLVYPFLQKYFVSGMTIGAVKG
ncbi:MAG: carbohydrate ABC transporter permease [Spirochaetales bacterium]|nr:carbohydrate ABC transporter permease [Spirochaetales bacterium]